MATEYSSFEVRNQDVSLRISCQNYGKHLRAAIHNLTVTNEDEDNPLYAVYATEQEDTIFYFDNEAIEEKDCQKLAVFFENTEYPIRVKPLHEGVTIGGLYIAGHSSDAASDATDEDSLLFGTLNFKNQVGRTDFKVAYQVGGLKRTMDFRTEVLSYKLDYRTDMRQIIYDIEQEYSMLSYSFLKQTYLSFKANDSESTDLIWWQIFSQCFDEIVQATKTIINNPKRRLKAEVRHERAERLRNISSDTEREYSLFQKDPHHLYRTEEMFLSKDTVENRFLKYAIKEMHRRFSIVREHIKNSLKVNDEKISTRINEMDNTLLRLSNHPFFRQIGQFKGFTQDSLVMKRARGYSNIYKNWLLLQCGYELEDSINHLEVKDISELYEIWCFIKVKNMVQQILGKETAATTSGKQLTSGFIRQLVYGSKSEVTFRTGNIELATVTYNAQIEKDDTDIESAIEDTLTFTTIQRPDIVLRLSKKSEQDIVYTYLFDAKYRLNDRRLDGKDVPPEDAINQMHRYRDAIYYADGESDEQLKKEIIGGYVLYPGNMGKIEYEDSYYHRSIEKVGIGAFPLRPNKTRMDKDGNLCIDPTSSEIVLYDQIKAWLEESDRKAGLLERVIPQKGLSYEKDASANEWKPRYYLERYPDADILIGCYHDKAHLDWILSKSCKEKAMYNIRLGSTREGAFPREEINMKNVKFVVLYEEGHEHENSYSVYRVADKTFMTETKMREMGYPRKPHESYECYILDEEVEIGSYDIFRIVSWARTHKDYRDFTPIFHKCSEMKEYLYNKTGAS